MFVIYYITCVKIDFIRYKSTKNHNMKTTLIKTPLYTSPSCIATDFETEGVLCASGEQAINSISDYVEETYQW